VWGITSACEVARQEVRRRGCSMFALLPSSFAVVPVAPPCCSVGGQWSTSSNRSFYLPGRFLQ
jgi:hypothetical protein